MKQALLLSILIFLFLFPCSAQSSSQKSISTAQPRKFDEFGNHSCEEYLAKMDYFLSALFETPNTKAYVMVYEGKLPGYEYDKNGNFVPTKYLLPRRGEAKSRIRTMRIMSTFRQVPKGKVVFIEAGVREEYAVEFWLVPNDSEPPKQTPTLKQMKYRKGKPVDFCGLEYR